jgi:predicted AAA+ superfamily ATPase
VVSLRRKIEDQLKRWKDSSERLVLLLRGARQVGKTYSIRVLGKTFPYFIELNFEEQIESKVFFDGDLNVVEICEKLSAYTQVPIIPGKTLLFFDEIQACPRCLQSLRFFHEKMPGLHVAAAGSLLEFAISEIPSFGVGRISSIFMYPMSFMEFLWAEGSLLLADYIEKNTTCHSIDAPLHNKLLERIRTYFVLGGMPAVIHAYCKRRDLIECKNMLDSLLISLVDDFAKYVRHSEPQILRDVFRSVSQQAGSKFMYSAIESIKLRESKKALDVLERAGLVYRIYHSTATGIPLGAQINEKRFKILPFDTGLHQRMLGLDLSEQLVKNIDDIVNKGSIAEVFAGLEMIAGTPPGQRPEVFYWHREQPDSNAEVDYIVQKSERIIPVEVKSGTRGSMQSLRIFLAERNLAFGIRLSQENASRYDKIIAIPLYMAGMIPAALNLP